MNKKRTNQRICTVGIGIHTINFLIVTGKASAFTHTIGIPHRGQQIIKGKAFLIFQQFLIAKNAGKAIKVNRPTITVCRGSLGSKNLKLSERGQQETAKKKE